VDNRSSQYYKIIMFVSVFSRQVFIKINETGLMTNKSRKYSKGEKLQNSSIFKGNKPNNNNESEVRNCHFWLTYSAVWLQLTTQVNSNSTEQLNFRRVYTALYQQKPQSQLIGPSTQWSINITKTLHHEKAFEIKDRPGARTNSTSS